MSRPGTQALPMLLAFAAGIVCTVVALQVFGEAGPRHQSSASAGPELTAAASATNSTEPPVAPHNATAQRQEPAPQGEPAPQRELAQPSPIEEPDVDTATPAPASLLSEDDERLIRLFDGSQAVRDALISGRELIRTRGCLSEIRRKLESVRAAHSRGAHNAPLVSHFAESAAVYESSVRTLRNNLVYVQALLAKQGRFELALVMSQTTWWERDAHEEDRALLAPQAADSLRK